MSFGERLKKILTTQGRSQAWLARQLGVHRSTFNNWAQGRATPPPEIIRRTAEVLNVSADVLLGVEGEAYPLNHGMAPPVGSQQQEETPESEQQRAAIIIPREEIGEHHRGRVVPIVGRIAAGDTIITTDEAEQFLPGDADAFVLFEGAPPHAFAVRVVGNSMDPPYRSDDIVIADGDRPVRHGLAVVVFQENDLRVARLKIMHLEPEEVLLLSTNPAYPPMRLPRQAVAGAWTVIAHLRRNKGRQ